MTTERRHHCYVCGEDMGVYDRRFCDPRDTCGKVECNREAINDERAEREEAHRQLDEDRGWGS